MAKERLRGYFRFGNRKLKRSTTDIGTTFTSVSSATGGGLGSSTTTTNTVNNTGSNHHHHQHRNSNTPIRYPSPVIPNGTIENHHITNDDGDTECTTTTSLTYSDLNKEFPRRPTPPTYITLPSSPAAPAGPIVDDFSDGSRNNYHHVPLQRQQYHRTRPHRHSSRSHHHHNKMMAASLQIGTDMSDMPDIYDS